MKQVLTKATTALSEARAVLIGAGAGMGVDSGLPDFRGLEGFWKAYPPFREHGLAFEDMANPRWFRDDPHLAWGFYGHRLLLYRATSPHDGFRRMLGLKLPMHVFTSNVDGQFQRAGFEESQVNEVHGSIHHLQCVRRCGAGIWPAKRLPITVNEQTFQARDPLPKCRRCGGLARPNVLMFGDGGWAFERQEEQARNYRTFVNDHGGPGLVVVEMGAGTAVPTVRWESECHLRAGATLIRINPRESQGPPGTLSLPMGARDAVVALTT
jgi:NAD-dependent SIR2 family protein deacetylase